MRSRKSLDFSFSQVGIWKDDTWDLKLYLSICLSIYLSICMYVYAYVYVYFKNILCIYVVERES